MSRPQATTALERVLLGLTLAATIALSLGISANRIMWNDEFLSFWSDSVPTARGVLDVQLHHPISLDPPTYHLLSHFAMELFGRSAIALRLPALAGFLLMQIALFLLVRRISTARAGIIAAAFPLVTASFRYSAEGRPYGLLLGLYAAAFACWYVATRETQRTLALVGLALSMALAITSHYFGILILIPICIAELARIMERRKLDTGMLTAIACGVASVALILPFQKALKPYRAHYYIADVNIHAVSQGYRELFVRYGEWPMALQRLTALVMVLATIALLFAVRKRYLARTADEMSSLWAGIAALALLPLFGFLFGKFVTHTMEVRYVIAALLAYALALALVLAQRLTRDGFFLGLYAAILVVAIAIWSTDIVQTRQESQATLASLIAPPTVSAALAPNAPIYTQSLNSWFVNNYYQPNPDLRRRFTLVYDQAHEVEWLKHDTNYVTAINLQHFATLPMVTYDSYLAAPTPVTVLYGTTWEWLETDLRARNAPLTPITPSALGNGRVYTVSPR